MRNLLSRRTFLRGLGVSMALPWMESLPAWSAESPKRRNSEPPVRFACLFSGNGFQGGQWTAEGEGAQMKLGKVLEPLLPFREKLNFIRGLYNAEALIGGIHSCQTGNLLTGAHLAPGGEILATVQTDQPCFACMLGGPDGLTLYMLTAPTSVAQLAATAAQGRVMAARVLSPRAGRP